ncbi:DNA primase [Xanthomonas phage NEB7]|nr:DNA primase [Xanthomonas phage NEB7]
MPDHAPTPPIRFTLITSTSCELAKSFELKDGKVTSSAIAHMTEGFAEVREVASLLDLRTVLDNLEPHHAITAGLPIVGNTPLTTRRGSEFNPQAVARTNEAFRYSDAPGLFLIDVDTETSVYSSVEEVMDALESASPWLRQALRVGRPSASSYVADRGLRGVHIYLGVTRGTDIPALAQRLQIDQWAAGRGRIIVSRSGALLVRQLSDALVYQPSRLMFEAAPVLNDGIARNVPDAHAWVARSSDTSKSAKYRTNEGFLDVQEMPAVRDIAIRRFETAVRQAKNNMRVEAKRVALDYHKANALAAGRDDGDRMGALALRALGDKVLPPSWPLVFEHTPEPLRMTVGDAMRHFDQATGRRCADPFDSTRHDLSGGDLRAAEVVTLRGVKGVWSHKLGDFFAFGESDASELSHPLELAAERLCGTIEEWPDRADKRHSSVQNLVFATKLLAREAGLMLTYDVCADKLNDEDLPSIGMWLEAVTRLGASTVSVGTLQTALETVARGRPVDPWKDAVLSLPVWDKRARLDTIFTDLYGTPGSPALTGAGQVFFAGLVMRQLRPGAPCPVVPVLIGEQRKGKGLFGVQIAEAMGVPLPSEIAFTEDRKMAMAAARSPVAELCEMSGLGKREVEDVKRWTTDTQDVYRAPYDRREVSHPRRYVLFGTANKHELNRDETGNSRFMPVLCETAPPLDWAVELPQILAEAKARFCDSWAEYTKLVRSVPELVKVYNAEDMRSGRGTVDSDLDDLLPPILSKFGAKTGRVGSLEIRTALDATPSGRKFSARQAAAWLKTRGWVATQDARGLRVYRAPEGWEPAEDNVIPINPFGAIR